jgi:toxin ParE1/3/4
MTKPVRVQVAAFEELREAVRWYEGQRVGLGAELYAAVEAAIAVIRESPATAGRACGATMERPARRVRVARFPYVVVFVELPEELQVLAVAHVRRRPGYWRRRSEGR